MKKGILILGSGHKNGTTQKLAESFVQGAKDAGKEVTVFSMAELSVAPCLDCRACVKNKSLCVQKDDMGKIYEAFDGCDTVVLASPVYFDGFSAQLKAVIDRFFALGAVTDFAYPKKDCALLMVAESGREDCFNGPLENYRRAFLEYIGWKDAGKVLERNAETPEDLEKTGALERAYRFGQEI